MAEAEAAEETGGSAFGFLGKKVFGKVPVWVLAVAAVGGYYWYTRYGPGKKTAATAAQTTGTDPAGNTGIIDPATGYVYGSSEDLAALAAAGNVGGGDQGGGYGSGGGGSTGGGTTTTPVPQTGIIPKGPGEGGPGKQITSAHITGNINSKIPIGEQRLPVGKTRRNPGRVTPRAASFLPAASGSKNDQWGGLAISNLISQGVPPDQASTAIQAHLNGQPLSPAMAASRDLAVDSIGPPPEVPAPAHVGGNVA